MSKLGYLNVTSRPITGVANDPNMWHITVMPSSNYKIDFEEKSKVTQKLMEWKENYKDTAVIGFWVSIILAAIKIYEFMQ